MNKRKDYDLLIVGAGIYGSTAAYKAKQESKRCLVIDVRPHLGGNIYCENVEGINVHKYGAQTASLNSIAIPTLLSPTIKESSTTCLST